MVKLTYTRDGFQFETKTVGQMVSFMRHIPPFLREMESASFGDVIECNSCGNADLDIVSATEMYCERCGLIFQMPYSGGGQSDGEEV